MPFGRRVFVFAIALLLLAAACANAADVVIVRTSDAEPYMQAEAALRQQLGQQMGDGCKIKSLLAREASDKGIDASIGKPDVVVAIGTASARWLHKQLPAETKLLYCMVSNPTEATLLQGHICLGVTTDVPIADQLKLVAEALPRARRIGLMYHSDTPEGKAALADLQKALPDGWQVEAVAVNDFPTVAAAIESLMQKPIDIAWTTADQKLYDTACVRDLLLNAVRAKIPVWGYSLGFVRAGALIGVGVEPAAQGRQAADLVIKTIADPSGFKTRAVAPDHFQIAVNKIVAEQIGIEIPDSVSHRAAFIYQSEK
jgi:putative ABC transport system substrate-binding protein